MLEPEGIMIWLATLGDTEQLLDSEEHVHIGTEDAEREMVTKLLRAYGDVIRKKETPLQWPLSP